MATNSKINVGVFGASGYTGFETISLLRRHPATNLVFATSESTAGGNLSDIYPVPWDIPLIAASDAPLQKVDAVFCCLPHGASMPAVIAAREAGVRVIDLSADFRLTSADIYQKWYGVAHESPMLLDSAVYGLPELFRSQIAETDLLANPGCYPTSVLLALAPLLQAGVLDTTAPIIADSKSGVSGAGRKPSLKTHFVEANENLSPYNIGRSHRHVAEMAQIIDALGGDSERLIFSPHLVPINRGMLSTIYVTLTEDTAAATIHGRYAEMYGREPLMHILPLGQLATMAHTQHTNRCAISISSVSPRQLILCSSIDNLGKGAAGQAVQNFNVMFGLAETDGIV
ncbi:MAG TPA: N-acetyl-gamma-glutamyl-phosphate reductase [Anaerolineae bacterium]|nr:N-acetyl-gamma-glutamyl-phosphate reductase [Anaerolineae bacterium]MCB0222503.1 N-acetyl-gamma-glutamyl-phosphate reductase [Anaerolineae bacterium]MCB9103805.1 N-acetyl-gamma-glutamyl-phosphate reductase [Anaerolineales bacterium]HRV95101.1 N-acetyl-gamma-glutamyl-phosphate reductase [Anaerolineae bacterium]